MGPKMPVSLHCETDSDLSSAIRNSLQTQINNVPHTTTTAMATTITDIPSIEDVDDDAEADLPNQLMATAKRALLSKIDYEEISNHTSSVHDNLKSKYIVLKPTPPSSTTTAATTTTTSAAANIAAPATTITINTPFNNGIDVDKSSIYNIKKNLDAVKNDRKIVDMPVPKVVLFPREKVQIGWESSDRRWTVGAGMINVGNTCYLNSTLQALFHVPAFANWLVSDSKHREQCEQRINIQGCIICAVAKTCIASQQNSQAIKPFLVYSKLKQVWKHLVPGQQEDAHEFLRYLMEAMEKAFLARFTKSSQFDQFSKETTPINQILGGYLKTSVQCLACQHISVTYQHFEDILLDIRKANSIDEALDLYFSRERLEDMGYKCESCKKKVSATKQFSLERAPIALCIQLKRFSIIGNKLNKHIAITPRLNLSKYSSQKTCNESLTYRLVSMVTHLGASQHCGHYTAIGITSGGGYYQFDDSSVRPISIQTVLNTNSYIMFYEIEKSSNKLYQNSLSSSVSMSQSENQTVNGKHDHNRIKFETNENCKTNGQNTKPFIGPLLPPHLLNGKSNSNSNNNNKHETSHRSNTITSSSLSPYEPMRNKTNYSLSSSTATKPATVTSTTISNESVINTNTGEILQNGDSTGFTTKKTLPTTNSTMNGSRSDTNNNCNFYQMDFYKDINGDNGKEEEKRTEDARDYELCNGHEDVSGNAKQEGSNNKNNHSSCKSNVNISKNSDILDNCDDKIHYNGNQTECNTLNNGSNLNDSNKIDNKKDNITNENGSKIGNSSNEFEDGKQNGQNGRKCSVSDNTDNDDNENRTKLTIITTASTLPSMPKLDFMTDIAAATSSPSNKEKSTVDEIPPKPSSSTDQPNASQTTTVPQEPETDSSCNKTEADCVSSTTQPASTSCSVKSKLKYTPIIIARQNNVLSSIHPKSLVPYPMDEDSESDTAPENTPEVKTAAGTFQVSSVPWLMSNFVRKPKDNSSPKSVTEDSTTDAPEGNEITEDEKQTNCPIVSNEKNVSTKTDELPIKRKLHLNESEQNTVSSNKLLKLTHNGYGASVSSWSGGDSSLDNEITEAKRDEVKEQTLDFNDSEIDQGHKRKNSSKKMKLGRDNPGYNPFQEHSNMDAGRPYNNNNHHSHIYRQNPHRHHYHNRFQPRIGNNANHYASNYHRHSQRPHANK